MKKLLTLIRREMWEYRTTFLTLPFVVGILMCLCGVSALILFMHTGHYPNWFLTFNPEVDGYSILIQTFVYAVSLPFVLILWLMVFNYFWPAYLKIGKRAVFFFGSLCRFRRLKCCCLSSLRAWWLRLS